MRQMKAIVVLTGVLGVAAVATVAATADPAPRREGRRPFEQQLGLSPEQVTQMERLRDEFAKTQVKRRAEVSVAHIELRELMRAPQLDDKAIVAKAKVLGDLQALDTRARIEHRLAMAKVLTPEQRAKAHGLLAERHRGRAFGHRGFFGGGPGRAGRPWGGGHAGPPDGGDQTAERE
jgi:Spy/CpxP family protein refolding chaperone